MNEKSTYKIINECHKTKKNYIIEIKSNGGGGGGGLCVGSSCRIHGTSKLTLVLKDP